MRYIPAHKILAIKNAPLAIPVGNQRLIPDQIFALDYGGSFRAFALEVDRGTEPKTSASARKSYAKSIGQYRQLVDTEIHKSHYGLKTNLLILWVFSKKSNEIQFLDMVAKVGGRLAAVTLTQTWSEWSNRTVPRGVNSNLFDGIWSRALGGAVKINK